MTDQETIEAREDTMVYRAPCVDSDEDQVTEIWGVEVETKIVDASEVPALLKEGWVSSPAEIGKPKKPSAPPAANAIEGKALKTAQALIDALTKERDELQAKVGEQQKVIDRQGEDLKAAEEMVDTEAKAKDAALAELTALKAGAKQEKKS